MVEVASRLRTSLSTLNNFFNSDAFLWVPPDIAEPVAQAFQVVNTSIEDLYMLPKGFPAEFKTSLRERYKPTTPPPKSKYKANTVTLKSFKTSKILRRLHGIVDMHQSLDLYLIFRTAEVRWHNTHTIVFSKWAACNYWKKEPYLMFTAKKLKSQETEEGGLNTLFLKRRRTIKKPSIQPSNQHRPSLLVSAQMTTLAEKKSIRKSGYYVMLKYINRLMSGYLSQWKVVTAVHSFISPWTRTQHIITQAGDNYIASYYAIKHAVCCFRRMSRSLLIRCFFKWHLKTPRLPNYQARAPRKVIGEKEEDSVRTIESIKRQLEEEHADIFNRKYRS
mmetsp:Transcript_9980/g.19748  ORF Transcript_9980/g.19748 Transcript_9980/m.19748 type:complete len:333 (-) Transcript_9980:2280-3278(-)